MKFSFYIRFFLTIGMGSCLNYVCAQGVSFSPSKLYFRGNPGETVAVTVTINNAGTNSLEFITSLKDWNRDTLGVKVYAPAATLPHSNAGSIILSGTHLVVGPKEQKAFTISMMIPKDQKMGEFASNSMLFFTQANAQAPRVDAQAGIGVRIIYEFGLQLFYTPAAAKAGELNFLKFEQQRVEIGKQNGERLSVKFENTGEINKDGQIRFELTNKETGEDIKLEPVPIAIMPKNFQWAYCPLPVSLPKGNYLAVAILDAGDNAHIKVAEKEIHIKK